MFQIQQAMYNFKEKKLHFNALRNPDAAVYDLELLRQVRPWLPQLRTYARDPKRYASDILYSLLDLTTRESIRAFRRKKLDELKAATEVPGTATGNTPSDEITATDGDTSTSDETAGIDAGNTPSDETTTTDSDTSASDETTGTTDENTPESVKIEALEQSLEEAEERAEEAEQRAEEAEEAQEEAETRAEEAEQALDIEKKKSSPKQLQQSPKARGVPANRLGQPLRSASPNSHTHLQRSCGHLETNEAARRKPG